MEETLQQKGKGIPGSTIKIIAVVAMLIDHISAAFITRVLIQRGMYTDMNFMESNGGLYILMFIMRLIGRLGFPIFCFLLVEGVQKTRSKAKYAFRLGLFALISEIPFNLAITGSFFDFGYQNVYFTLLIGMLAIWAIESFGSRELKSAQRIIGSIVGIVLTSVYAGIVIVNSTASFIMGFTAQPVSQSSAYIGLGIAAACLAAVLGGVYALIRKAKGADTASFICINACIAVAAMFAADLLKTDYAGMGVLTILVMYWFRKSRMLSMAMGCVVLTVMSVIEGTAFLALIPISKYNGERGLKMKYFFYAFYPVHLFLIWLAAYLAGMGWIPAV